MNYQEEEKGLFTFYREQQQEDEKNRSKKRKKQAKQAGLEDTQKQLKPNDRTQSEYLPSNKQRVSITFAIDSLQKQKEQLAHVKQYGNSVVIINRMHDRDEKSHASKANAKQPSPQKGSYLENKSIQFDPSNKQNIRAKIKTNRKVDMLNRKFDRSEGLQLQYMSSRRELPLIKNQDHSQSPHKLQIKKLPFSLKSNGSDFIRELKNKITHEMNEFDSERRHSVSFIEYNQDYLRAGQIKKGESLTQEQRRVLQLLYRYRSPNL